MTIFKEEIYYKQQTLQIFLVYFDEYEFHFAFLQISEQTKDPLQSHQILVKELYLQKIKEIFNKFIKNDSLQKISNIFQDFKNKNKKFFKANFYRTSRKICLFFIDSFQDFPAEEIKISNEIFNIFFNNFLEICWKSYSTSFSFVYKDKKEIIDLSYLCPITSEEDNLKIFKFNEEKEDLVLKTEISEKQIVREFFCSWRKTNLILNFYNIKHNNFIEFS